MRVLHGIPDLGHDGQKDKRGDGVRDEGSDHKDDAAKDAQHGVEGVAFYVF